MGIVAMDGTVAVIGARGDRAASETEPEAFLLQCALRRGQEKTPGWGFFIAGTETRDYPAHAATLTAIRIECKLAF